MGMSSLEISGLSQSHLEPREDRLETNIQEMRISADKYTLLPIAALPGSTRVLYQAPQPGCIYIDAEEKTYRTLGDDAGMRAGYECVVMLGASILFDEDAKRQTKKLYLVETVNDIILHRYNGKEWCATSCKKIPGKKDPVYMIIDFHGEQKEYSDFKIINQIIELYGCHMLVGTLEGLDVHNLELDGLKQKIIQKIDEDHNPKKDSSQQRKRQRTSEPLLIDSEPRHKTVRRRLGDEFENVRNSQKSNSNIDQSLSVDTPLGIFINAGINEFSAPVSSNGPSCGARVSSGLGSPKYNCHLFFPPLPGESNQEGAKENAIITEPSQEEMIAELKAKVENEDPEACMEYAQLLMTGGKGVEMDPILAQYLIGLAEGLLAQKKRHEKVYDSLATLVAKTTTEEQMDDEKEETSLAGLIARVQQGDITAYAEYAELLKTGSGGVKQDEELANTLLVLAAEEQQVEQPPQNREQSPSSMFQLFQDANPFDLASEGDNQTGRLSPAF